LVYLPVATLEFCPELIGIREHVEGLNARFGD